MIPMWLIFLLTFPGVIMHEMSHKKFCDWLGVRVQKVVYFKFGNPAGFVLHEAPSTYRQIFWISIGPLILSSIFTVLVSFIAFHWFVPEWSQLVLLWIAFSIGFQSFPSNHDMRHISGASRSALGQGGSFLHYLAFPFVWLIKIANTTCFFWFNIVYALLLILLGSGL